MIIISLELCTPLIDIVSKDKLGVELWQYERYAGPDWKLPGLVGVESIECHVGRQAIDLRGSKVWATTPLFRVSDLRQNTLITHFSQRGSCA